MRIPLPFLFSGSETRCSAVVSVGPDRGFALVLTGIHWLMSEYLTPASRGLSLNKLKHQDIRGEVVSDNFTGERMLNCFFRIISLLRCCMEIAYILLIESNVGSGLEAEQAVRQAGKEVVL